jgi:predicted unusual protein kinase regulating ubiquinone biosynthesis (AarF/ABC1/UbiB family)
MEGADIIPPEFSKALAILRDSANTMPDSQIRRVMGREYGKGWEDRFENFDFRPIAAASIGQVHRAMTKDGRDLALKIQYPGVAKSIDSDVDNMALFMRMANIFPVELDVKGIIAETKRQLRQEADYTIEARYLRDYRALVADDDSFVVPRVHDDFTTRHILAMDFVDGVPLESLGEEGVPQELRDRVGMLLERLLFRELFEFRTMQTDPNFANYFFQPETGRIVLLDFGSTMTFEQEFTDKYRDISRALIEEDDDGVLHYAERIGYLDPGDSPAHAWRILELIQLICDPIRQPGVYDFHASDITVRARDHGLDMAMKSRGELRSPPPETVFLHRKLIGSFLVCARIRARVDVQQLILGYL